jgi:hypothetical protein
MPVLARLVLGSRLADLDTDTRVRWACAITCCYYLTPPRYTLHGGCWDRGRWSSKLPNGWQDINLPDSLHMDLGLLLPPGCNYPYSHVKPAPSL